MNQENESMPIDKEELKISEEKAEDPKTATSTPLNSATTPDVPSFGWSAYAERINGRFAMIGFASILIIEAFGQDTFLHWAGLVP